MDEYQEVFGVPAEAAQEAPAGEGENEREDAGPAPGEGERDQEVAVPGAEEQQEEAAPQTADAEAGAAADRQTGAEERHRQAQLRRRREEAERQTAIQASRDKIYAEIFAGQVNPFTGKPITGEADYRAWLTEKNRRDAQQQRLQAERRLSDAGLPADALRQIISQEVERHPAVQQARQATMQAALQSARAVRQRAQETIGRSLTAIAAEFPEIKSLEDIAKMPTAGRFNELVQKGVGIEDAFFLANRQELDQRRRAASRQAAINAAQGKRHLSANVSGETADAVDVPSDMAESYREMMPGASDAEIRKAYASYLRSIGKK